LRKEVQSLKATLALRTRTGEQTLSALRADRGSILRMAGFNDEPHQLAFLRSDHPRELLCTSRQFGKSTCIAAKAVATMVLSPASLCLCLSPSLRQSGELFGKAVDIFQKIGAPVPVVRQTASVLELSNRSRLVSLPGKPATIRGYSKPKLVAVDEAAYCADELHHAVSPMMARSDNGVLILGSSPYGMRGEYWRNFTQVPGWRKTVVTADQIPAISPEYLRQERLKLGERWFRQEFYCSFESTVDAVFDPLLVEKALEGGIRPPILGGK
jgi:hypothetical protein